MTKKCPQCGSTIAAVQRLAYSINEGLALISKSRAGGYRAMAAGDLSYYMDGRRRMITHQALLDYIALMQRRTSICAQPATVLRKRRRKPGRAGHTPSLGNEHQA